MFSREIRHVALRSGFYTLDFYKVWRHKTSNLRQFKIFFSISFERTMYIYILGVNRATLWFPTKTLKFQSKKNVNNSIGINSTIGNQKKIQFFLRMWTDPRYRYNKGVNCKTTEFHRVWFSQSIILLYSTLPTMQLFSTSNEVYIFPVEVKPCLGIYVQSKIFTKNETLQRNSIYSLEFKSIDCPPPLKTSSFWPSCQKTWILR